MNNNAPPSQNPFAPLARLSWRAVLTGAVTDILLTFVVAGAIQLAFMQANGLAGAADDVVLEAVRQSPVFWVLFALGILISGIGGFVAGWLASEEHLLHGLVAAFLTNVVFGVVASANTPFTLVEFAGAMAGLLAGLAGGWLAGALKARR